MAYNRTFNPDALPAFAEPERKQPSAPPPTSSSNPSSYPQRHASNPTPSYNNPTPSYNKPAPALPRDDRHDYHASGPSSSRPVPSVRDDRHDYHTSGPSSSRPVPSVRDDGRRGTPVNQPPGNYAYGQSPPGGRSAGRYDGGGREARDTRDPRLERGPASPGLAGEDPSLLPLFRAVDKDASGRLSEEELSAALVNGDWSSFDAHTVTLMIRMFDTTRSGTISFGEFCGLWSFLASWRTLFDRFDADRSGGISPEEFAAALVAFGYRLTDGFVGFLFRAFDKQRRGSLSFDLFVQACITLKRMTDAFKRYDDDRDGFVTLSFEQFLEEVLKQR